MKKKMCFIILCLSGILIFLNTPLKASIFYVTTTEDQVDGSLRQAVSFANSNSEDDTIYLPAGIYFLSGEVNEDANAGGDLDIANSDKITIIGDAAETTIIDGDQMDRVFHILKGTVSISGVTIQNGRSFRQTDYFSRNQDGGGIHNSGNLSLTNCIITRNRIGAWSYYSNHGDGGGIYNTGTLTITGCTINYNRAADGRNYVYRSYSGHAGGIYNRGILTMTNSSICNNKSGSHGGCRDGGVAGDGGGIYNHEEGEAALTKCVISGNSTGNSGNAARGAGSGGAGGGIYNQGALTLNSCLINNNTTGNGGNGGGDFIGGPGWGGSGGGIFNIGEKQTILTNCTISSNSTGNGGDSDCEYFGGGSGGYGGGIFNNSTLTLTSCTICNNSTGEGGEDGSRNEYEPATGGFGGGIRNYSGTVSIQNTIVGNNQVAFEGEGPDCSGSFNSQGYNLVKNVKNCTFIGDLTGNIIGCDPLLALLADNGGPTRTHALLINSPAVDAGTSAGIAVDQRGYERPKDMPGITNVNDGADIGAYELSTPYSISGRITCDNIGLPGVTLTFSNGAGTTFTDANGDYSHPIEPGWSGTITPSKEDYTFTPSSRSYSHAAAAFIHQDYTASPFSVTVTIIQPEEGATVSGTVTIAAAVSSHARGAGIQAVTKVEFYIDGTLLGEVTSSPFQCEWDTGLSGSGEHTIKANAYNAAHQSGEDEITVNVSNTPCISVSRSLLNFRELTSGVCTYQQEFTITNSGSGILNWTIHKDRDWLNCTPTSGTNSAVIIVSLSSSSDRRPGTYTGTITIESPDADNSPQTVTVNLAVSRGSISQPPFGSFDTPIANTTVMSSVPFTGWVLDDIHIVNVKIYREPVNGEGNGLVYIGKALFVEGARPDIEQQYPDHPDNYKAGWGYMMLTSFLPEGGNGYFTFHVKATDCEEQTVTLGTKTVYCDNQSAVKPFGTIDTPPQGGTASGSDFVNFGWVLTPLPDTIPKDGSTINVWVDGVCLGNPVYNRYRSDIADLFPGYNNDDGALGFYYLDTTKYKDGVHTIAWSAADDAGNVDGIGSRYFTIMNPGTSAANKKAGVFNVQRSMFTVNDFQPVWIKKGFNPDAEPLVVYPGDEGIVTIKIKELERLEIHFFEPAVNDEPRTLNISRLPIGSTLDRERGIFYWQPGVGFFGEYRFLFIQKGPGGEFFKRNVNVSIEPE